jgi:hypothetical protein
MGRELQYGLHFGHCSEQVFVARNMLDLLSINHEEYDCAKWICAMWIYAELICNRRERERQVIFQGMQLCRREGWI